MMRSVSLFALISVALAGTLILPAQNSDQTSSPALSQVVDAAFPQSLRFVSAAPSGEGSPVQPYHTCATMFSRMPDGTPNLVAAGYSGDGAEIAMLRYKSGAAQIIDAVTDQQFWLTDGGCQIEMVNLAAPGQPDSPLANTIKTSFEGPDWFLIWDGEKLRSITALESEASQARHKRPPNSAMYLTGIVDIDHRGAMQIIGKNGDADKFPQDDGISSTGTLALFRFNGSTYASAETMLECEEYEPNLPKTKDEQSEYNSDLPPWTEQIDMHQKPAPSYQLEIVNGDRDGSNRVTSAKVEINGAVIVSSTEVNQSVETLTWSIQLQKENTIKVTVDGPAKSHVYVTVE